MHGTPLPLRVTWLIYETWLIFVKRAWLQDNTHSRRWCTLHVWVMCCSVLQCVAVCCSVLQSVAVCCRGSLTYESCVIYYQKAIIDAKEHDLFILKSKKYSGANFFARCHGKWQKIKRRVMRQTWHIQKTWLIYYETGLIFDKHHRHSPLSPRVWTK